jgi:hypothetical protein
MGDFTTAGEVESVTAHEVINMIISAPIPNLMGKSSAKERG